MVKPLQTSFLHMKSDMESFNPSKSHSPILQRERFWTCCIFEIFVDCSCQPSSEPHHLTKPWEWRQSKANWAHHRCKAEDKDKPPGTILRQFDAPKMHRTTKLVSQSKRCTNVWRLGANLPLLLRKGNHASIPIDMKVWRHCDHWPSDKSVSLRLRICALLTWRIQLVSCEQAGTASWQWFPTPSAGTPVLGTLGPSWAPQTEATRQAAVVRLSSFPSTKRAAKRGENAGNHQLRSMIFIKFYHCEISINILPSHKFFLFILHLEDHAGFLWWCQSSRSPRVQGALSAGQFTRRRRFDVTSLAQRTQPMQQLFRNSYGLVADAYL